MKNRSFLLLALLGASLLSAQENSKKYVLIEHFTNSNCGTCANKNPALFNLIGQAQYADDVHHVSVHPMFPYPQCVFYQANTTENTAWTSLYPVGGTPTIVLNGALQNPSTPILTEAKLQSFLNQTSPLYIEVTESGPANARQATVKAKVLGDVPSGTYKIFVAIVEKKINQQTPNGETVHHNVFRKMLTAVAGNDFTVPSIGETVEFQFNYSIPAAWNADEVYVLAFVKETTTKQVLNSGTRFDPVLSKTGEAEPLRVQILPNPVAGTASINLPSEDAEALEVYDANGARVSMEFGLQGNLLQFSTATLTPGIYFVKVSGSKTVYTGKFLKL